MGESEAKEVMVDVGAVGVEGGFALEHAGEHDSEGVEDGDEEDAEGNDGGCVHGPWKG